MLGVALLGWAQHLDWDDASGPFRVVLWLSVIPGALAVLAFLLLVRDPQHSPNPALRFVAALRELPARFKRSLGAVGMFSIGDFSHSLLILAATQLLTASMGVVQAAQVAGLLYVGRNTVQVLVSVGALVDRFGSRLVLLAGYALGALTAALAASAFWWRVDSVWLLTGLFAVAGLYVAVQEALESTVAAEMVGTRRARYREQHGKVRLQCHRRPGVERGVAGSRIRHRGALHGGRYLGARTVREPLNREPPGTMTPCPHRPHP